MINKLFSLSFALQWKKINSAMALWFIHVFCNTDILLKWLLLKTFSAVISCFDPSALTVTQQTHQRPVCFDWPVCWTMEQRLARRWCFSVALTHKTKKRALIWCNIGSGARNDYKTCHGMSLQSLLHKAEQYDATEGEKERRLSVFIIAARIIFLIF